MLNLMVLLAAAGYLFVSILVVRWAMGAARARKIKAWKYGVPAALFMYLIVFWDHIPTLVIHKYYCATEAGFWVYKTPEQWAVENPGGLETLKPWPASKIYGKDRVEFDLNGGRVELRNDRFGYWSKIQGLGGILPVGRYDRAIIDIQSKEVIAKSVVIRSGIRGHGELWKSWLTLYGCGKELGGSREMAQISRQLQMHEQES